MTNKSNIPTIQDYFLKPGFIYMPEEPTAISTVLGSSVAICLYDKTRVASAMNHYLFPLVKKKEHSTAVYGNVSIPALISMLEESGSKIQNIKAQIFGGAYNPDYSDWDIGRSNVDTARRCLHKNKIRIVSEDVGGELGRKIIFNTLSFDIAVLKVEKLRESDWHPYNKTR